MGVNVDPARRQQQAVGIDFLMCRALLAADRDDGVAGDGDVAVASGLTAAVDDERVTYDDVVHGGDSCCRIEPIAMSWSGSVVVQRTIGGIADPCHDLATQLIGGQGRGKQHVAIDDKRLIGKKRHDAGAVHDCREIGAVTGIE